MLSYIYQMIQGYEQEHGFLPNLLYLNDFHCEYLKSGFADHYTLQDIQDMLNVEMIINQEIVHPHVAWSHNYHKRIAS